jgi:hypothetical protein
LLSLGRVGFLSSIVLIQSTQGVVDFVGDAVKAGGYFGYADSLYTVAVSTQNFIGNIYIEASLSTVPNLNDWFPVQVIPAINYLQYPRQPTAPTGQNGGDTGTSAYTFRGNFVFLRARIDRSFLYNYTVIDPYYISLLGTARIVLSRSETIKSSLLPMPSPSAASLSPSIIPLPVPIPNAGITNVGDGYQIYSSLSAFNVAQLRTLVAGQGISIVQDVDTLTLNATGSSNNFLSATTSFADTFTQLSDVPATYVGAAGYFISVNVPENGLTFTNLPPVALSGSITDTTGVLSSSNGGTGLVSPPANSILIGSSDTALSIIQVPLVPGSILSWNGNQYQWIDSTALSVSTDIEASTLVITDSTVLSGDINLSGAIVLSGEISILSSLNLNNGGTSITVEDSDDSNNIATTAFVNSFISAEINNLVERENNLSDLTNIILARINLGLGQAAILNVGDIAGTVADAGDMISRDAAILAAAQQFSSNDSISEIALENAFAMSDVSGGEYY